MDKDNQFNLKTDSLEDDDSSSSSSDSSDDFNVLADKVSSNTGAQSVNGGDNFEDEHKQEKEEINKKYDKFPFIVEGPEFFQDHSFFLMHKNDDIASLERGICLEDFQKEKDERILDMEFRILNRICHTMVHFQGLYREHNQEFKAQNRYNDVLPYKHNLVEVKDNLGGNIYVNGSYINVPIRNYGERAFIAASAPVEKSLNNFWEMIFQNKVTLIIMLCNLKEKNIVCEKYWEEDEQIDYGNVKVKLVASTEIGDKIIKRTLEVSYKDKDDILIVTQLHHTNWPDDNAPTLEEMEDIDHLIQYTMKHRKNKEKTDEAEAQKPDPILVHCSAGIGRTGTFIALHCMIEVLEAIKSKEHNSVWAELRSGEDSQILSEIAEKFHNFEKERFSIFGTVRKIKEQRFGMVKTQKQYEFLYSYMERYIN
jgi:protein tyrosine phosphatase